MLGRQPDRLAETERVGFEHAGIGRAPSALFAARMTFAALRLRISAKTSSTGVTPARASSTKRQASAISTARSVSRRIRPGRLSSVASSSPAVSITVKRRSPSRASPSRRSRVTPGWSSTSASRLPTSRLNSVDLPTFGRPTMASLKDMGGLPPGSDRPFTWPRRQRKALSVPSSVTT
jgi:hypothetical protein